MYHPFQSQKQTKKYIIAYMRVDIWPFILSNILKTQLCPTSLIKKQFGMGKPDIVFMKIQQEK